ncbi:hypothetical protein [Gordonia humi]|uniref:Transmembrane protein n=1 Tax=Gordonia humi TaxID=686429 RepID=A0A840F140_9ACTN|nr:hypothetical protein [Gordonia humi]MBB4136238.1 hypothetical protein [Gordonia humi]
MTSDRTPGLDDHGEDDPVAAHAPADSVRPLKAVGLIGYGLVLAALAFLAVALTTAGGDTTATPWIVATAVCGVVGISCIAAVRVALVRHPAHDRAQHDPLIPEITREEALDYEQKFHGRPGSD